MAFQERAPNPRKDIVHATKIYTNCLRHICSALGIAIETLLQVGERVDTLVEESECVVGVPPDFGLSPLHLPGYPGGSEDNDIPR